MERSPAGFRTGIREVVLTVHAIRRGIIECGPEHKLALSHWIEMVSGSRSSSANVGNCAEKITGCEQNYLANRMGGANESLDKGIVG
jgi:hypothetical protein